MDLLTKAVLAGLVLPTASTALLVGAGYIMYWPKENTEYVILKGNTVLKFSSKDRDLLPVRRNGRWKLEKEQDEMPAWERAMLYDRIRARLIGFPFLYRLGNVIVNYPPQLRSESGLPHPRDSVSEGFHIHHNYEVFIEAVDFQGLSLNLYFNLEVELTRPDVAWGKNGTFLNPLGQAIEGAVNNYALTVNTDNFIGTNVKNSDKSDDPEEERIKQEAQELSRRLRQEMCDAIMELNVRTNTGTLKAEVLPAPSADFVGPMPAKPKRGKGQKNVPLSFLCGYEIVSISYKGMEGADELSKSRLQKIEEENQEAINTRIGKHKKEQAKLKTDAETYDIAKKGHANNLVVRNNEMNAVYVLKKKREALGDELMVVEMHTDADKDGMRDFRGSVLVKGKDHNLMIPLPMPGAQGGSLPANQQGGQTQAPQQQQRAQAPQQPQQQPQPKQPQKPWLQNPRQPAQSPPANTPTPTPPTTP